MSKDHQWEWKQLCKELGEEKASQHVANRLRELADIVESGEYPRIFGWTDGGEPNFIATYTLTLSHPWPG